MYIYIYTPLLSLLSSFPNPSLRSIGNSTAYPFFRKKEKKGGERDTRGILCNSKWPILRSRICCFYSKWLNFVPREPPARTQMKKRKEEMEKKKKKKEKLLSSPVEWRIFSSVDPSPPPFVTKILFSLEERSKESMEMYRELRSRD